MKYKLILDKYKEKDRNIKKPGSPSLEGRKPGMDIHKACGL
jgi:hypothetical protein